MLGMLLGLLLPVLLVLMPLGMLVVVPLGMLGLLYYLLLLLPYSIPYFYYYLLLLILPPPYYFLSFPSTLLLSSEGEVAITCPLTLALILNCYPCNYPTSTIPKLRSLNPSDRDTELLLSGMEGKGR